MNAVYFLRLVMGLFAVWLSGMVLIAIMLVAHVPFLLTLILSCAYCVVATNKLYDYLMNDNGPDKPVKIDKD